MRAKIVISEQRLLNMCRDSNFCAEAVRYNIFANGAPYVSINVSIQMQETERGSNRTLTLLSEMLLLSFSFS